MLDLPCPPLARALTYPDTYFRVHRMFLVERGRRDRRLRARNALVNRCAQRITGLMYNFAFVLMLRPGDSPGVRVHLNQQVRLMSLRYLGQMGKITCPPMVQV